MPAFRAVSPRYRSATRLRHSLVSIGNASLEHFLFYSAAPPRRHSKNAAHDGAASHLFQSMRAIQMSSFWRFGAPFRIKLRTLILLKLLYNFSPLPPIGKCLCLRRSPVHRLLWLHSPVLHFPGHPEHALSSTEHSRAIVHESAHEHHGDRPGIPGAGKPA